MRVHHLNCGSFCLPAAPFACHCLLIESREGLVLVDTGLGLADLEDPRRRLGTAWTALLRPEARPALSARRQIEERGFTHDDVRHVIVTHLDVDHAGGIPDFPAAKVHVYAPELDAAMHPRTPRERFRYRPALLNEARDCYRYELEGDRWFGFEAVRPMGDLNLDILLIPLVGHSVGHCGVAVRIPGGWLLDAGDAYVHHDELWQAEARAPWGAALYQQLMAAQPQAREKNLQRLRRLARERGRNVTIFSAHAP
jgi:glyoxylase-like metal-dependent hydrolase (beta-lactamase superfamily II)